MLKNNYKERDHFTNNNVRNDIQVLVNMSLGLESSLDEIIPSNFNLTPSEILSDLGTTTVRRENESNNCSNSYLELLTSGISNLPEEDILQEKSDILEKNIPNSDDITFVPKSEKNNENVKNVCPHCFKSFRYPSLLKRHLRIHERYQNSKDDESEKYCKSSSKSKKSAKNVGFSSKMPDSRKDKLCNKKIIQQCPTCLKSFKVPSKLIRHIKTHVGLKPYVCHLCSKAFLEKQNFMTHKLVHSKEQPHVCNICQKAFGLKSNLSRHLRIHTEGKLCKECGVVCSSEKKLSSHVLHHQENLHKCNVCEKEFKKKSNLKRHLEIHSNTKEYPCNNCDYIGMRKYYLERHVRRNHAE